MFGFGATLIASLKSATSFESTANLQTGASEASRIPCSEVPSGFPVRWFRETRSSLNHPSGQSQQLFTIPSVYPLTVFCEIVSEEAGTPAITIAVSADASVPVITFRVMLNFPLQSIPPKPCEQVHTP